MKLGSFIKRRIRREKQSGGEAVEIPSKEEKVFAVPWGSEDVCFWCKRRSNCQKLEEIHDRYGERVEFDGQPARLVYGYIPFCPTGKFEADEKQLPEQFKDRRIKQRYVVDKWGRVIDIVSMVRYGGPQGFEIL